MVLLHVGVTLFDPKAQIPVSIVRKDVFFRFFRRREVFLRQDLILAEEGQKEMAKAAKAGSFF